MESFKRARGALIRFSGELRDVREAREEERGKKRKRRGEDVDVGEEEVSGTSRRKTRSQGRKGEGGQPVRRSQVADSEEDEEYQPGTLSRTFI